jgi:hypothetical protein
MKAVLREAPPSFEPSVLAGRYDCQSVPAVRAGAGPDAGSWQGVEAENMTQTGTPQHVSSAQNEPAGQV